MIPQVVEIPLVQVSNVSIVVEYDIFSEKEETLALKKNTLQEELKLLTVETSNLEKDIKRL
uniref:Uncharacterized protein n=1 Tax=Lepeophtheirus salmonis TaxID=72036 RepID=A0A0K2TKC5_LEPSM